MPRRYMTEDELIVEWGGDPNDEKARALFKRKLWKLRTGRHPSGLTLDCLSIDREHRAYPVESVQQVEKGLIVWAANYRNRAD